MFERFKKWLDGAARTNSAGPGGPVKSEYQPVSLERVEAAMKVAEPHTPKVRANRAPPKKAPVKPSPKEVATIAGEPYVNILSMEIDPKNINNGAFELDWNDKFLLNLIKAGYKKKDSDTDNMIVDRWFHEVCRNIVLEMYEQGQADPENREPPPLTKPITAIEERVIVAKPLPDGRSEIS